MDYDPHNIYAPVASQNSIRILISIAGGENLQIEGTGVSNAYLHGDIDVPIIIEQPTNSTGNPTIPGHVCSSRVQFIGQSR